MLQRWPLPLPLPRLELLQLAPPPLALPVVHRLDLVADLMVRLQPSMQNTKSLSCAAVAAVTA